VTIVEGGGSLASQSEARLSLQLQPKKSETNRNDTKILSQKHFDWVHIMEVSERENEFILALLNEIKEEPNKLVKRGELYALAKRVGFSEREVYKYAMDFDLHGYVKAEPILGGKIFSVMLTVEGIEFARQLRQKDDR